MPKRSALSKCGAFSLSPASLISLGMKYKVSPITIYYAAIGVTWKDVDAPVVPVTQQYHLRTTGKHSPRKTHQEQTVTWISKRAMRFLTRLKVQNREAVGLVLDRVLDEYARLAKGRDDTLTARARKYPSSGA